MNGDGRVIDAFSLTSSIIQSSKFSILQYFSSLVIIIYVDLSYHFRIKKEGKLIIITTHINELADFVYEFDDKKVTLIKSKNVQKEG